MYPYRHQRYTLCVWFGGEGGVREGGPFLPERSLLLHQLTRYGSCLSNLSNMAPRLDRTCPLSLSSPPSLDHPYPWTDQLEREIRSPSSPSLVLGPALFQIPSLHMGFMEDTLAQVPSPVPFVPSLPPSSTTLPTVVATTSYFHNLDHHSPFTTTSLPGPALLVLVPHPGLSRPPQPH